MWNRTKKQFKQQFIQHTEAITPHFWNQIEATVEHKRQLQPTNHRVRPLTLMRWGTVVAIVSIVVVGSLFLPRYLKEPSPQVANIEQPIDYEKMDFSIKSEMAIFDQMKKRPWDQWIGNEYTKYCETKLCVQEERWKR